MSILYIAIIGGLIAGISYIFAHWRAKKKLQVEIDSRDEIIDLSKMVVKEMYRQVGLLENALSSQIVERSTEVGLPPPSGAYHTVFYPTDEGHVMMVYLCLDSGHIARWHFYSADAIESEGKRFLRIAQAVREKTLPQTPEFLSVQIGNNGMIH